jgi:hypothetical protein
MTGSEAAEPPAPAVPAPSLSESMQLKLRRASSSPLVPLLSVAVVALVLGLVTGRATAPTVDRAGIAVVTTEVATLAVDADALWTAGANDLPAVGDQVQELRRTGDASAVTPYVDGWLEGYDSLLRRVVGVDVPPAARPVQRQFQIALTLNRDAVELLASTAAVDDPALLRDLTSEVLRLRIRAEEVTQSAHASLRDLSGGRTSGVSEPDRLPSIEQLR